LGVFFAWCASARIRADGPWSQPSLSIVGSYVAIILIPCTAYLYLAHPDWCWMYLFDASRVPRLFVVPIVAATAAATVGGYNGTARMLRIDRLRPLVPGLTVASGVFVLLILFLARGRLSLYGSYGDYPMRALHLSEVKLGYVLIAMVIGVLAASAFVGWELWRDGRRAAALRDPTPRAPTS
jgi:hypothetical protein